MVIGAHLDTVPVAPGAEDNASGIAVMLQLAEMASQQTAAFPVQFIAFGAEEPRGSGDALHHFGSRQFVAGLSRSDRRTIQAMVALDRVGVPAGYVPICTADTKGSRLRTRSGRRRVAPRLPPEHARTAPAITGRMRRSGFRCPARQHTLCGLPLSGRRATRRRPAPARSRRPDGMGLAGVTQLDEPRGLRRAAQRGRGWSAKRQ